MLALTLTLMPIPMLIAALPMIDSLSPLHSLNPGASLRDRATLPSPLRGLGPSGGYPSRLRSLRSLRAPLARRLATLALVRVRERRPACSRTDSRSLTRRGGSQRPFTPVTGKNP